MGWAEFVEAESGSSSTEPPSTWHEAIDSTISDQVLRDSLPHRTSDERAQIAGALLGVTTWQAVCDEFQIPRDVLIPRSLRRQAGAKKHPEKIGRTRRPTPSPCDLDQPEAVDAASSVNLLSIRASKGRRSPASKPVEP